MTALNLIKANYQYSFRPAEYIPTDIYDNTSAAFYNFAERNPYYQEAFGNEPEMLRERRTRIQDMFGEGFLTQREQEIPALAPTPVKRRMSNESIDAAILEGRNDPEAAEFWNTVKTTDEIKQQIIQETKETAQEYQNVQRRAEGPVAKYGGMAIGAIGGTMADPFNASTMLVGAPAGMGWKGFVATEAGLNMLIEAIQTPDVVAWQEELGEEVTAVDIALNIATAGVAGGVFAGGVRGAGKVAAITGAKLKTLSTPILKRILENKAVPSAVRGDVAAMVRANEVDAAIPADLEVDTRPIEALSKHREALNETIAAIEAKRQPRYSYLIENLSQFSFRATGTLSPDNTKRIVQRYDQPTVIYETARFNSRQQADKFIRGAAKQDGVQRTDFIVERNEAGDVIVLQAQPNAGIMRGPDDKPVLFKSAEEANQSAKSMREKGEKAEAISLNPKAKKAEQKHIVVRGIDAEAAAKIKNNPEYAQLFDPNAQRNADIPEDMKLAKFLEEYGYDAESLNSPLREKHDELIAPEFDRPTQQTAKQDLEDAAQAAEDSGLGALYEANYSRAMDSLSDEDFARYFNASRSDFEAKVAEMKAEQQAIKLCGIGR